MEQAQLVVHYDRHREILLDLYEEALSEIHPEQLLRRLIQFDGHQLQIGESAFYVSKNYPVYVIGTGKASGSMALALESILGDLIKDGIVLVEIGFAKKSKRIQFFECDHPLPTEANRAATLELQDFIESLPPQSIVINLISGGTSAILFDVNEFVSVASIQQLYRLLLESGADIQDMNTVRKQFSEVLGGRLLKKLKNARLVDIILSDVPGNDPATIGSGPTTIDATGMEDALLILENAQLLKKLPADITNYIYDTIRLESRDKPQPGDDALVTHKQYLLGTSTDLAKEIALKAQERGFDAWFAPEAYSCETRKMAIEISRRAIERLTAKNVAKKPYVLVFHGESYVHVKGEGKGGRNQELALTAAISLEGQHKISLLSIGTDGKDGKTDAAGALINGLTTLRARGKELNPEKYLQNNDSFSFFKQTGDLVFSAKHQINLMDIQIVLIEP